MPIQRMSGGLREVINEVIPQQVGGFISIQAFRPRKGLELIHRVDRIEAAQGQDDGRREVVGTPSRRPTTHVSGHRLEQCSRDSPVVPRQQHGLGDDAPVTAGPEIPAGIFTTAVLRDGEPEDLGDPVRVDSLDHRQDRLGGLRTEELLRLRIA